MCVVLIYSFSNEGVLFMKKLCVLENAKWISYYFNSMTCTEGCRLYNL